ncbi:hypothetical protein [Niastella sp. OAS944]|uniref:hypothetical protein n=1 Tax=Niastella sp. OAS944 TaxID=2664089 RepID=UPI0035C831E3|nr:hypothetical protein [Chitinophagaceae bacterium OAS944]
MKQLFYLICLYAVCSCGQQEPINAKPGTKESKHKKTLAYFFNIGIDTLEVSSPQDSSSYFYGKEIDSAGAMMFPEDIRQRHFSDPPQLFGIFKFAIDSNRLGLIARTPSEYVPSSIKLFFFDLKKDTITNYIELGETWGDAGDFMQLNSWLFRDSSKHLQTLIWEHQGHDNSVDDPKDTTIATADYYTLLDISTPRIDTIFERKEKLPKQFEQLVKAKPKK